MPVNPVCPGASSGSAERAALEAAMHPETGDYLIVLRTTTPYPYEKHVLHAVTLECVSGECDR